MPRWVLLLIAGALAAFPAAAEKGGAKQQAAKQQPAKQEAQEQEPPEEDVTAKPKVYAFNPLQATKEVQVGNYYFKKGSWNAAAQRFREATKWNPGMAEAWLRLGEAEEKRKDFKAAKEAYAKYLEAEPDSKQVGELKKKMSKWQ